MTIPPRDPWSSVEDIDGLGLYRVLNLQKNATTEDIRKAYRECARIHHPDKGGNAERFSRVQAAFETLSDPRKRAVYDEWAKELQFRYVPGVTRKDKGGEDVLLDEFEGLGLHCEAKTQLVVICEVCGRPSTKECWTCGMKICDFCTLKRHWKDTFPLHWPLINSDHMRVRLAKRELEQKRVDDARRLMLQTPNSRTEQELITIRAFKSAAYTMLKREDRLVSYTLALARFYMWAQTDEKIIIAFLVPTGYQDMELDIECTETGFRLQPENSPPVLHRLFDYAIDTSQPIETFRTEDNRCLGLVMWKQVVGEHWRRLFRGDSDGARCMLPPYQLTESDGDVIIEIDLPFWICPEDVDVKIFPDSLHVSVRNEIRLSRTYWQSRGVETQGQPWKAVDVDESMWCLEDDVEEAGETLKTLMISLIRPPPTESEITWKKGKRQNNQTKERPGSLVRKGFRFFADDEDEFELEDLLAALCFMEAGSTWVPSKPWETSVPGKWVTEATHLPASVQQRLKFLLNLRQP